MIAAEPPERPRGVFAHERLVMVQRGFEYGNVVDGADVAQRDGRIAREPAPRSLS